MPTISYAITAHNEHEELKRLLDQIVSNKQQEDEIVVQVDEAKVTDDVMAVLLAYSPEIASVVKFPLNKDFASFKNNLKRHCKKDYIFFVDADEYFSANLIYNLPKVVEQNPEADLFGVPRVNTVEGITEDHIKIWNWVVDEKGRVNWPDYQTRLVRNSPNIEWVNKVHERIQGYTVSCVFPNTDEDWCLYHPKTIERQIKQNNLYSSI